MLKLFLLSLFILSINKNGIAQFSADIRFKKVSITLNVKARKQLDSSAKILYYNNDYKIGISSFVTCDEISSAQQWDRTLNVIKYLVRKGVSENRILFYYDGSDDPSVINIQITGGLNNIPAPHPKEKNGF